MNRALLITIHAILMAGSIAGIIFAMNIYPDDAVTNTYLARVSASDEFVESLKASQEILKLTLDGLIGMLVAQLGIGILVVTLSVRGGSERCKIKT